MGYSREFHIFAHGVFWGTFKASTPEEAIQAAADAFGTVDVGETRANTKGMTAEESDSFESRT
ncbi:hypothetical protein RAZWK3B_15533 [Roseobacter sp. AzwK-3b]|uniref:hypothetical protein n=1 Tax=Roseobacter sp. AzwK-3b TaxID=351016 RepID=UPI000156A4E6|nr:hypothetical protein [Roseobacter sp. AzwK-3b]EDM70822.1 hypothetical protein RAZWK3B_15533 [Roseobacter sp. AzwK-3b]